MDMSQTAIFLGFDLRIAEVSGFSIVVPDFITMSNLLIIFIIWIIIPLGIGYYFYKKRDI
jgi:ABC-type transport system involved in multi-copper enzyme maturation permease subunit